MDGDVARILADVFVVLDYVVGVVDYVVGVLSHADTFDRALGGAFVLLIFSLLCWGETTVSFDKCIIAFIIALILLGFCILCGFLIVWVFYVPM